MSRLALLTSMPAAWESLVRRKALSRWPQLRRTSAWVAFVFSTAVFAIDWLMPSSGAVAMFYVLSVALVLGSRRQESLVNIGVFCFWLTVAGYFVGEANVPASEELIQRGAALTAMGLMA